jgi:hypothetical protein
MRLRCNGLFVFLSGFYNWRAIYDKIDLRVTPPEGARNNLEHGFTDGTEGILRPCRRSSKSPAQSTQGSF